MASGERDFLVRGLAFLAPEWDVERRRSGMRGRDTARAIQPSSFQLSFDDRRVPPKGPKMPTTRVPGPVMSWAGEGA